MNKKVALIVLLVILSCAVAVGLGVLIFILTRTDDNDDPITVTQLEGDGIGSARYSAAITTIPQVGNIFWWFYPAEVGLAARGIVLWLDGVTGLPPSLFANFGMFGPYDFNLEERTDSWIDEYALLFVDPAGTGFSTLHDINTMNVDDHGKYLATTLKTFYQTHPEYAVVPLYIIGQGSGAQLAVSLAERLTKVTFGHNLRGLAIGNGIVSPALALTKLGFYLDEWGYIDGKGRETIEEVSENINNLMIENKKEEAFDTFLSMSDIINEAGAIAINAGYITEKLPNITARGQENFGQIKHLKSLLPEDLNSFMQETVAKALGIDSNIIYDEGRERAIRAVKDTFMIPSVDKIERLLDYGQDIHITIYNGNLDALSNTPGQLEWVNNLQWEGRVNFINSPRHTLVLNGQIEGYFRKSEKLQFFWVNVAGQSVPLDNPVAMRHILGNLIFL